jgi:hypothetical protein
MNIKFPVGSKVRITNYKKDDDMDFDFNGYVGSVVAERGHPRSAYLIDLEDETAKSYCMSGVGLFYEDELEAV